MLFGLAVDPVLYRFGSCCRRSAFRETVLSVDHVSSISECNRLTTSVSSTFETTGNRLTGLYVFGREGSLPLLLNRGITFFCLSSVLSLSSSSSLRLGVDKVVGAL